MTDSRQSIDGLAMLGGGAYDEHSKLQAGVLGLAAPLLERAVAALPAASVRPLCIADYGCATGNNSIDVLARLVRQLRARFGAATPLLLQSIDLPLNDWGVLARQLDRAVAGDGALFASMIGRSFFGPVLPAGSLDLGWSASAVHWLSTVPEADLDHLWPHPRVGAARAAFTRQAERDWRVFLEQRARELRAGGQLVVVAACAGADGRSSADHYLDLAWEVIRELERAGRLEPEERARLCIPTYFRNRAEYLAPFDDGALPLRLKEYDEVALPDALWDVHERTQDATAFARVHVGWLRAFSEPLLGAGLGSARSPEQRRSLLDELYHRIEQRVALAPGASRVPWTSALLRIERAG